MMTGRKPITEPCAACKQEAVLALWDSNGQFVLMDPDETGYYAGSQDGNGFAWVRPAGPGAQLALGESLYRLHETSCPAPLARVRDIVTAPSLRRRRTRTETPRRTASAR
jgi:hypothetical protein